MKKAVFLGKKSSFDYVYSKETLKKMFAEINFPYGERVFVREELDETDMKDIDFVFSTWGMLPLSEEEIERYLPSLKCVFYAAGSVQYFARPFLSKGVRVFSAWAANAIPVSEYTYAQITLANIGYYRRLHLPASGPSWSNRWASEGFGGNYETTVGIIGAGMIGSRVARLIRDNMEKVRVLVFDPFLPEDRVQELRVTRCDLPTLFAQSDVITNHLANNPRTVGMLNGEMFKLMKPYATFINTGRGAQTVESDLIEALKEVPTRTAILDVTLPEPPKPDSEFYTLPNVFLSPHIAGSMGNEVHRMAEYMLDECRLYESGKPSRYEVTLKMLETMA